MIGSTSLDLPQPNSGEEFELLMADLLEAKYDSKTSRHGRSGQSDDGVDIYFINANGEYVGVQCKRTDDLSLRTIQSEVENAIEFSPELDQYIIATSAPQDKTLQEEVRQFKDTRDDGAFDVDLWMWDDVERLLAQYDSVFQNYYGEYLALLGDSLADANIYELTDEYFEQKTPRSAKTAWQLDFTLSEIQSGYAFDRSDEDGDSLTTRLTSAACSGEHIALCGEAGSGKSTVVKQVCCQLYEKEVPTLFCPETSSPETAQDTIEEWVTDHQGGVIVIEDAHRAGFETVFELIGLCEQYDHIGLLTTARELDPESREPGQQLGSNRPRPSSLDTICLPPLSIEDVEAAVERYEHITDSKLQISPAVILKRIRRDPHNSSALSLVHVLSSLDKEANDAAVDAESILHADARDVQVNHESECERLVAMLAVLLKVSKLPLRGEFFHALATQGYSHEDVDAALSTLEGSLLFGNNNEYHTKHELWCVAYLEQSLSEGANTAVRRFERCINSALQLAVDPDLRTEINSWYRREVIPADLHQPFNSGHLLRRLFYPGLVYNQLINYYGESQYSGIEIPEAVPESVSLHQYVWRGAMALARSGSTHGKRDADWAQREYQALLEELDRVENLPEPARDEFKSIALTNTAHIKKNRGEIVDAKVDLSEALELDPFNGPSPGKSTIHSNLAELYMLSGDHSEAESHFRQACAIDRELGDKQSWAKHVGGLAVLYFDRGEARLARACNKTAKRVFQETGDLQSLTQIYGRTSDYLFEKGDYEAARDLTKQSLQINRQLDRNERAAEDLMTLGSREIRRQNPVPARQFTEQARSKFAEAGNERAVAQCDGNLANIEMLEENWALAKHQQEDVIDRLENLGDKVAVARAHADLGNIYLQRGNFSDALPQLQKAAKMLFDVGEYRNGARALLNVGQILYQQNAELEAGSLFGTAMMGLLIGDSYDDAFFALDHVIEIHLGRSNPKQSISLALQGWLISRREEFPEWERCFLLRYHGALGMFYPSLYTLVYPNLLELLSTDVSENEMSTHIEQTADGKNETGFEI